MRIMRLFSCSFLGVLCNSLKQTKGEKVHVEWILLWSRSDLSTESGCPLSLIDKHTVRFPTRCDAKEITFTKCQQIQRAITSKKVNIEYLHKRSKETSQGDTHSTLEI